MLRIHRARFLPVRLVVPVMICCIGIAQADPHAGKLLLPETDVIVTLNVRDLLDDYWHNLSVQRYLDQWHLAAQGDERQLLRYYETREIQRYEGLSRREFLERASLIKAACDAFGNAPFEDVDLITIGYATVDQELPSVAVAGRFKQPDIARRDRFFRQYLFPVNQDEGPALEQVGNSTLVFAGSRKTMQAIQSRAAQEPGELAAGRRTLFESGRKHHLSVVVNNLESNVERLLKIVTEELASSIGTDHPIGKFVVSPATDWLRQYAPDFAAVSFGISARQDELRLEFGLDAKNAQRAAELRQLIEAGSFLGVHLLKAIDHELAPQAAGILARLRTTQNDTTVIVHLDAPYEFIAQVQQNPLLDLFPDKSKTNANAKRVAGQAGWQGLAWQVTSIPLWKAPVASDQFEEWRGVPYKTGQDSDPFRHRLDMFRPRTKKGFPIIVLVHGGAWDMGDNRCAGLYSSVGEFLASQGIGVVLPNYRLSPGVKHPAHVEDVASAIAWTMSHAGEFGGDARRLYLVGHSAGGHLVALLAADESYLRAAGMQSSDIKGVISCSGVYRIPEALMYGALGGSGPRSLRVEHMLPLRGESGPVLKWHAPGFPVAVDVFGPAFGDASEERAAASPITHVRRGMPPFLILAAEHELPTLGQQAEEFHAALRDNGCNARLVHMPRRNHNSLMFSAITPQDPAARLIIEFVNLECGD